jgi:pyruvate dehydrogenase E2 component (dihydrolipoamide acetyltransferase)
MPQVGQDILTAKIIEWRKKENERVEKGEVVLVVESDKAAFEVEAEESGVLLKILYQEGDEVEVFKPLAYVGQPGEESQAAGATEAPDEPVSEVKRAERQPEQAAAAREGEPRVERVFASPSARRVARELGVSLNQVRGSGPNNRITKEDVLAAASSRGLARAGIAEGEQGVSSEDLTVPFDKTRKRIAEKLTLSKQTIPHFYLSVDVDMSAALEWRAVENRKRGAKITITDMIIKACAVALAQFERMNAHGDREKIVLKKRIHIGVATSVERELLVPVIPDADKKSLLEISEISKKNAEGAKRGIVNPRPVGTFTVTTLGMHSIKEYLPIINPPECGILAVGTVEKRVVPLDEAVVVRDMMTLTLACDHRAVDGVYAARFLNQIKAYLEKGMSGQSVMSLRTPGDGENPLCVSASLRFKFFFL